MSTDNLSLYHFSGLENDIGEAILEVNRYREFIDDFRASLISNDSERECWCSILYEALPDCSLVAGGYRSDGLPWFFPYEIKIEEQNLAIFVDFYFQDNWELREEFLTVLEVDGWELVTEAGEIRIEFNYHTHPRLGYYTEVEILIGYSPEINKIPDFILDLVSEVQSIMDDLLQYYEHYIQDKFLVFKNRLESCFLGDKKIEKTGVMNYSSEII